MNVFTSTEITTHFSLSILISGAWELRCKDKKEKSLLFRCAKKCGLPIGTVDKGIVPFSRNESLAIGYLKGYGLLSYPGCWPHPLTSVEQFKAACDEYKNNRSN